MSSLTKGQEELQQELANTAGLAEFLARKNKELLKERDLLQRKQYLAETNEKRRKRRKIRR